MYKVLKGTHDVILSEADKYTFIEKTLAQVAEIFGFKEFRTPIIESSDLFMRSVGGSSDIVRKEMYAFEDKGGRNITLRPEMTAGTIRSIVEAKLFANQDYPIKAYYVGPNFRYERPQQGRYRQFNQFGIESVGSNTPYRDAEVITYGDFVLKLLGFKNLKLKINTLGDDESKKAYHKALKEYLANHVENMCEDCKGRYELNVLRVLDCKVPHDIEIVKNAPKIIDFLTDKARIDFEKVLEVLDVTGIEYEIDPLLVRGLDYYSGVVFEYHYTSSKAKNYGAIGAGGHYDKLVKELDGPELEGVGTAFGIERLASIMDDDELFEDKDFENNIDVYVMPFGDESLQTANLITMLLRANGFKTDICFENKSFGQMFKKAERRNALVAIILGEEEIKNKTATVKNLETQTQKTVKIDDLVNTIDEELMGDDECSCRCGESHNHDHECKCHSEVDDQSICSCGQFIVDSEIEHYDEYVNHHYDDDTECECIECKSQREKDE